MKGIEADTNKRKWTIFMDLKDLYYLKFILGLWRWLRGQKHLLEKSDNETYNPTKGLQGAGQRQETLRSPGTR